jgi:uncharacterized protein (TIGR02300 family)
VPLYHIDPTGGSAGPAAPGPEKSRLLFVDMCCQAWHLAGRFLGGVHTVAKTEWGLKRICQSCGARFYDLGKSPIACPKCGAEFDPEAILKSRRGKSQAAVERAPAPKPVPAEAEDVEVADEEVATEEGEEEEEAVMEDTSELGEDNDDVAEVIDNVNDEEER